MTAAKSSKGVTGLKMAKLAKMAKVMNLMKMLKAMNLSEGMERSRDRAGMGLKIEVRHDSAYFSAPMAPFVRY
jgi:hypothetical protein